MTVSASASSRTPGVTPVRMLRELAEALEVLTRSIPLVLVLEDLHWSDVSTVNLLTYLAQRRDPARLLVLGTYRPADVVVQAHPLRGILQELRGRGVCDDLALELLLPDEVEAYTAARLGGEVTAELVALLYHQTEGNALFLVNLLEHLVEQGVVKQEGAQWTLRSSLSAVPSLPEAPQLLITKRFERLDRDAQHVLEVASVAGDVFAAATVAAGLDVPVAEVEALCATLGQQHDFLEYAGLDEWPDGTGIPRVCVCGIFARLSQCGRAVAATHAQADALMATAHEQGWGSGWSRAVSCGAGRWPCRAPQLQAWRKSVRGWWCTNVGGYHNWGAPYACLTGRGVWPGRTARGWAAGPGRGLDAGDHDRGAVVGGRVASAPGGLAAPTPIPDMAQAEACFRQGLDWRAASRPSPWSCGRR